MTAHSNGGQTWSTKLTRIGELSANDGLIVFNNLGHIIDKAMLRDIFQQLDERKAVGLDGMTKSEYQENLEENLEDLLRRIRRGTYVPKPSRITEIAKEDGSMRPLAISCFEDKIVQMAISQILHAIYEPRFLNSSYGYRPNRSGHDALRALHNATFMFQDGAVVEIDISKYFNSIPHGALVEFLRMKISDDRFLRLVNILMKAPTCQDGSIKENTEGSPQSSILSPILSNIYLHHVIDEWFASLVGNHFTAKSEQIRYCDDMVFVFERREDAERFFKVLPKRLGKYGLTMHRDKSQIVPSGHVAAKRMHRVGQRMPTFRFLGFMCYWGLAKNGWLWRLKCKSRNDRLVAKLKGMRKYLKENIAVKTTVVIKKIITIVSGWMNYHSISDNERRVGAFVRKSKEILLWWINRKGGQRKTNWEQLCRLLDRLGYPKYRPTIGMFTTPRGNNPSVPSGA